MQISYERFPDKKEFQSLLVINARERWKETLYFTFYTPWGEAEEQLYAGRAMADVHHKNKPCSCVLAFDFHRWDPEVIKRAVELELPATGFEKPLAELLQRALTERDSSPDGFKIKVKA